MSDGLAFVSHQQKFGREQLEKTADLQREYLEKLRELNQPKTDWISAAKSEDITAAEFVTATQLKK
jgi:hypothetical protein